MGEGGSRGFGEGDGGPGRDGPPQPPAGAGRVPPRRFLTVDERGRIDLPPDLAKTAGASPGTLLEVRERDGRLEIRPDIHSLSRLYIEPTSRCNLACQTCIRNTWAEPMGDMGDEVFGRIAARFGAFPHLRSVMFAGFGEPTVHPKILDMIAAVHRAGLRAELTTNGTRLDETLVEGLFRSGLDRLWVSIDGADEIHFTGTNGRSNPLFSATSVGRRSTQFGMRSNTGPSERTCAISIFRPATSAAAAVSSTPTTRTVSAMASPPAAAASGPRGSSNAPDRPALN
jgi:hypothetical protein